MTASKIFLCLCLSFIGGVFLNSFFQLSQILLLEVLILGILFVSVFWRHRKIAVFGFFLIFLALGVLRHQAALSKIANSPLQGFIGKEVILEGFVLEQPDIGAKSIKFTVTSQKIEDLEVKEKILIVTKRYPEFRYGDFLKISGRLEAPQEIEGFNYKNYLAKDGIYSVINFPEIELLASGHGNLIYKPLFSFKNKFKEAASNFISPPQEGFLEALIFGDEENISKEWKEKLNITGTRHIVAVSGMNITIIASLILSFCLSLGLWRKQAFYLSVFLLTFYILMIGAPSSAIRAGIMALFFLLAQHFGRLSSASHLVVFAAAFMLFQNPFLLTLDIGFQLSFLAILGMIYFQPIFSNWLSKIPDFKFFPLKTTLIATLSAQVFTLPILVYNFGYVPLISPPVNILIVPFLAPITILVFIFGLLATLFLPLGYLLFWLAWLFLTYIVKIIDWFSKLSFASISFKNTSWIFLIIYYLLLGFLTYKLNKKLNQPLFLK